MYDLSATFTPVISDARDGTTAGVAAAEAVTTHRRVRFRSQGFHFFALVTGNDTDPAYVADSKGNAGTANLGRLWRINGAAIFGKGTTTSTSFGAISTSFGAISYRVLLSPYALHASWAVPPATWRSRSLNAGWR